MLLILCAQRVSEIPFISYAHYRNIGKPNNLKVFGSNNTKSLSLNRGSRKHCLSWKNVHSPVWIMFDDRFVNSIIPDTCNRGTTFLDHCLIHVARSLAFCVIFPRSLFDSCCSIFSFLCFPRSLFVLWSLFHLVILLCVLVHSPVWIMFDDRFVNSIIPDTCNRGTTYIFSNYQHCHLSFCILS
jgi:hypothetical protein